MSQEKQYFIRRCLDLSKVKALLIGVCKYTSNRCCDLPLCAYDVEAVKSALIVGLNILESDIIICGHDGIVTIEDVNTEFKFLTDQITNEETFIFYFSGHGGKNVLALSDGNINLQILINKIEKISVKNKIIILDSCYSGNFAISDTPDIDLLNTIETFAGYGYAVLASCGANQTSSFREERELSIYTSFFVDALNLDFLARKGKKSLESINEAIFQFAKIWNSENPKQVQNPIFRSNIGGTIFFDVKEYKPYNIGKIFEETERYIIYNVEPVHTGSAKRFSVNVILRQKSSFEEIVNIADEIKDKLKYVDVYQNEVFESTYKGKAVNIIWCYFGYSEDDIIEHNYICHTMWADSTQDKKWWYKVNKNACIINNIYLEKNPSYEIIKKLLHDSMVPKADFVKAVNANMRKMINAAQDFIKIYREYCNDVLSENDLIDSVEPLNQEIEALYFQQRDLPHPSKEVHEWANKCTQLTGTIHDFSLYYNKKYLDKWTRENRRHLMNSSIKRYEADLEELRMMKI